MADRKKFYVTTPIYYVNDVPHIGHAYTTVAADALARFKRLQGYDVRFLTGTDEHGQKVEKAAAAADKSPQEFADGVMVRFRELWERLGISNDDFIRTTEDRHKKAAQALWRTIVDRAEGAEDADIYRSEYEDWYCTPCENFLTENQLAGGKCPDCGRDVERLKEESYFFRLSMYGEKILDHIERNPSFVMPVGKRNEITSFLREGLRDLSVSRTTFSWGVPVPDDPKHVMYVWFDALSNYLTSAGYPDSPAGSPWWPADVHIIGKDILRFHTVYWPAFLMAAGLKLPKRVFAHGWWTVEGEKMSKSKGNVVDPHEMIETYGVDAFRYFLLREVRFGHDGDFSISALVTRTNSDLANDLGNLLSRTVSMILKYRDGGVPAHDGDYGAAGDIGAIFSSLGDLYSSSMDDLNFYDALVAVWSAIRALNAYVDQTAPWKLAKEGDEEALSKALHELAEGLRIIAVYVFPFMPASAERIWEVLGIPAKVADITDFASEVRVGARNISGLTVTKTPPLFPRIDVEPAS